MISAHSVGIGLMVENDESDGVETGIQYLHCDGGSGGGGDCACGDDGSGR